MRKVRVKVERLEEARMLQTGDLFCTPRYDQKYWDWAMQSLDGAIGLRTYIRTEAPADLVAKDSNQPINRLTIEVTDE